jgi:undecaprenyl-diphosphatase
MAIVTIKPTRADIRVANTIAAHTTPATERAAQCLTCVADEHVLVALSAAHWLYVYARKPQSRPLADHLLATSLVTAVVPHALKRIFDQTRPDRRTLRGHWRGVPLSGRREDAFPSGHAVHMGALVGAADLFPFGRVVRSAAIGLSITRVILLAHWTSDVVAGLALGAVIERLIRPFTLNRRKRTKP